MPRLFPNSSATWAAAWSITSPAAIWTFQESSSPILDKIGSNDLAQNQALLYAQAGDTEPIGAARTSLEFDTTQTTEWTGTSSTTFTDLASGAPLSVWVRFRMPAVGANRSVCGKGLGSAARWSITVLSTGALRAQASDNTTTINAITTGTGYADGNYHDCFLVWDRSAATPKLWIITESESASTNLGALSAVTATGEKLKFGGTAGLAPQAGLRVSYAAVVGAALTTTDMKTVRAQYLDATGIATLEAFGTATLEETLDATGIASAESVSSPEVLAGFVIDTTAIASAESVQNVALLETLDVTGIATAESVDDVALEESLDLSGIATLEAFGSPALERFIDVSAIASGQAFGTLKLIEFIDLSGIASAESVGTPAMEHELGIESIESAEAEGEPHLARALDLPAIPSAETVPSTLFVSHQQYADPTGIATGAAFGTPMGVHRLGPTGALSGESLGPVRVRLKGDGPPPKRANVARGRVIGRRSTMRTVR